MPRRHHRMLARGLTLLETMIALSILLFGLVATMNLQLIGISSNHAANAETRAAELATELVSGLERLPLDSALLSANASGSTSPSGFGQPLRGNSAALAAAHAYDDASAIPGTRTDAQLTAAASDVTFQRRWTVWDYSPTGITASGVGNGAAAKLIAVSVIYTYQRTGLRPGVGEVVMYTQRGNPGMFLGDVAAYR